MQHDKCKTLQNVTANTSMSLLMQQLENAICTEHKMLNNSGCMFKLESENKGNLSDKTSVAQYPANFKIHKMPILDPK